MDIPSPFEGLDINRELVCEFFATFSRVEYSLKEMKYVRNVHGVVSPAWWRFAQDMSDRVDISASSELEKSIGYLCAEPPMVQVSAQEWQSRDLHGETDIERSIDATCRVRNNLFHGGKYTPHSPPGRDQRLVESAQLVLLTCVKSCGKLHEIYV